MTLPLQHPFTLIIAGPSPCGKPTFVIRLLGCKEQLCNTVFKHIVWCHSENNAPHHLKDVSFLKGVPDFENLEHVPTIIVLDYLTDSAYSSKVCELFAKGPHHRNISLVLITQNLFHQSKSSRDISLNSKYIVVFKNPRDKTQIVHLARQVYPENISSFRKMYLKVCKEPHTYLFLDLTQSIND
jgi:ABC-type dipeptide/oligopeptide/nickel transport system ATPase subunit